MNMVDFREWAKNNLGNMPVYSKIDWEVVLQCLKKAYDKGRIDERDVQKRSIGD